MPPVTEQNEFVRSHLLPEDATAQGYWAQRGRAGLGGLATNQGVSHRSKVKIPGTRYSDRQLDTSLRSTAFLNDDADISPYAISLLRSQSQDSVQVAGNKANTSTDPSTMHATLLHPSAPIGSSSAASTLSATGSYSPLPPATHSASDGRWSISPAIEPVARGLSSAKDLYLQAIGQSPGPPHHRTQRIGSANAGFVLPSTASDHRSPSRDDTQRTTGFLPPSAAHYDRLRSPSLRGTPRGTPRVSLSQPLQLPEVLPSHQGSGSSTPAPTAESPDLTSPTDLPSASPQTYDLARQTSHQGQFRRPSSTTPDDPGIRSRSSSHEHRLSVSRMSWASLGSDLSLVPHVPGWDGTDLDDLSGAQRKGTYSLTEGYLASRRTSMASGLGMADVIDIFAPGDRLYPGMRYDGCTVRLVDTIPGVKERICEIEGQLEIVRKLGEGTYATVYLVQEVSGRHHSVDAHVDSEVLGSTPVAVPHAADGSLYNPGDATVRAEPSPFATMHQAEEAAQAAQTAEPRQFALKCFCKRDLSSDMVAVQKLEASIHQSLPSHPNIVTLYCAYETPDWLFLVLEFCPGQDLYYWLEQAQDDLVPSDVAGLPTPDKPGSTPLGGTPPNPSLLATTSGFSILSWNRLRLISRMFQQMCSAVQFCHERGIAHRDLKPENFIVEDRRHLLREEIGPEDLDPAASAETTDRVIIKLTDFGLATNQQWCDDVECGSKPYMSYECCNDEEPSYEPIKADVWSLGICLLNMIFHRSPWQIPSADQCPSFAAYEQDPEGWLLSAFDGLTPEVASFLAKHVFNPVSTGQRVSVAELGTWSAELVSHLGLKGPAQRPALSRGASMGITTPLQPSRSRANSVYNFGSGASNPAVLPPIERLSLSSARDISPLSTRPSPRLASAEPSPALHASPYTTSTPVPIPGHSPNPAGAPNSLSVGNTMDRTLRHVPSTVHEGVASTPHASDFRSQPRASGPVPAATRPPSPPPTFAPGAVHAHESVSQGSRQDTSQPVRPPRATRPPPQASSATVATVPSTTAAGQPYHPVPAPSDQAPSLSQQGNAPPPLEDESTNVNFLPAVPAPPAHPPSPAHLSAHAIRPELKTPSSSRRSLGSHEEVLDSSDDDTASAAGSSTKPRRRKRGARKGSFANRAREAAQQDLGNAPVPPPGPSGSSSTVQPPERSSSIPCKPVLPPKPLAPSEQLLSWRERNQSNTSITPRTSMSSVRSGLSDDQLSIYSSASAPAEIVRRSHDSFKPSRSAMGLQPISEQPRAKPAPKDLDASFLAEMFGGAPKHSRHGYGTSERRRLPELGPSTHSKAPRIEPNRACHSMEDARPTRNHERHELGSVHHAHRQPRGPPPETSLSSSHLSFRSTRETTPSEVTLASASSAGSGSRYKVTNPAIAAAAEAAAGVAPASSNKKSSKGFSKFFRK